MKAKKISPTVAALRKVEASVDSHLNTLAVRAPAKSPRSGFWRAWLRRPHRLLRKFALYAGVAAGLAVVGFGALWWRLGSGPIAFDVATPWLTAAIEENFGSGHRVEVGGTQI